MIRSRSSSLSRAMAPYRLDRSPAQSQAGVLVQDLVLDRELVRRNPAVGEPLEVVDLGREERLGRSHASQQVLPERLVQRPAEVAEGLLRRRVVRTGAPDEGGR